MNKTVLLAIIMWLNVPEFKIRTEFVVS